MTYINPAARLRYHHAHLAALQRGEILPPINVEIDLTNRCSLGCEWCHFAYTHTRGPLAGKRDKPEGAELGGDVMDSVLAKNILTDLYDYGVQSVTWTGGGEPTLHPDFDPLLAWNKLPQGVYTHGGHIDAERAAIMKRRCKWVYVSLDECSAEAYKQSKGVDGFGRAIAGIQNLTQADGDAVIGVGFLLHEDNYEQIPNMRPLAKWLGADYVHFRPTVRYDINEPSKKESYPEWVGEVARSLQYIEDYNDFILNSSDRFWDYGTWSGHTYDTCHWSALQTVITPNGKMWTCVNKREFAGECIGDLTEESFRDIWERHSRAKVDHNCRVMCRGHYGNLAVEEALKRPVHAEFV